MKSNMYQSSLENSKNGPGLAGKVAGFADFLREHGFNIFQSSVHDALRGLQETGLSAKEDTESVLRANLVTNDIEWHQFSSLFYDYWDTPKMRTNDGKKGFPDEETMDDEAPNSTDITKDDSRVEQGHFELDGQEELEWLEGIAYSPVTKVEKKDLGNFNNEDIKIAELSLKKMMDPFRIQITRRKRRSKKTGVVDISRVLKSSMKTEGIPLELSYMQKKKRLKRLVILADVSGSMDRYARFVMPFILGLRGVGSRAEVFVFSTSLVPVTFIIRHMPIHKAMERISEEVPDWSGGTRIGYSLRQFNRRYSKRLINKRTVVIILSDGWDLGSKDLLRKEMVELNRKAHRIVWLNPLAGDRDFEPVCQGMKTALPYINYFLPADSLSSLQEAGRLLSKIMVH
ncbi:VWA domain-containing protein [Thermodesulfobacteriota bacterium]